jgi:phosphoadenosine phosphosulfate reductase
MKEQLATVKAAAEKWTPERVLQWSFDRFGDSVAISSALGVEGMVLIHMAALVQPNFRLFTLDTEFLFPETHDLMDRVEEKYGVKIEKVYSLSSPEEQERAHGPRLWERDPDNCCNLRKVQPLRQKLGELEAWITSIRRDQTAERAAVGKVEWDAKFGLVKINPIADWNSKQVWHYIRTHDVPYNSLHERNYPSIGCTHCTRAVLPGEDSRAGRWTGLAKTECGLHVIGAAAQAAGG